MSEKFFYRKQRLNRQGFDKVRAYLVLAIVTLALRVATALPLTRAGYMDASYTIHVGANLVQGRGLVEDILWNYLDRPTGLPHPSNLYWLPLPAMLAAGSFLAFGVSYHSSQVPFILLSLFPPLFAFYLARRIFAVVPERRETFAWTAGLLAAFSGFYTIYWVSPDNFTPFAVTADLALLFIAFGIESKSLARFFLAGIFIGIAQLARADAVLLLAVIPLVLFLTLSHSLNYVIRSTLIALVAFLLVIMPWLWRNFMVVGTPLPQGGLQTLWLTTYDEFFSFDVSRLTFARYLEWGVGNIIASKLSALGFNLLVLIFGGLLVFLAPFAFIGLWQLRNRNEMRVALIYLVLLLIAMSFIFTYPSTHGSMLHSSSALVTYLAVAVPLGLDVVLEWVSRRRRTWNLPEARQFFQIGFVALAVAISIFLYTQGVFANVIGGPSTTPLWNQRDIEYAAMDKALQARSVPLESPVLTVDPPSFHNETGRRSIYIPTESTDAIFQAAHEFGSRYLVLQYDHPRTLNGLYDSGGSLDGLTALARTTDALGRPVTLFAIER